MAPTQLHFPIYYPHSVTEMFVSRVVAVSPIENKTRSQARVKYNMFIHRRSRLLLSNEAILSAHQVERLVSPSSGKFLLLLTLFFASFKTKVNLFFIFKPSKYRKYILKIHY